MMIPLLHAPLLQGQLDCRSAAADCRGYCQYGWSGKVYPSFFLHRLRQLQWSVSSVCGLSEHNAGWSTEARIAKNSKHRFTSFRITRLVWLGLSIASGKQGGTVRLWSYSCKHTFSFLLDRCFSLSSSPLQIGNVRLWFLFLVLCVSIHRTVATCNLNAWWSPVFYDHITSVTGCRQLASLTVHVYAFLISLFATANVLSSAHAHTPHPYIFVLYLQINDRVVIVLQVFKIL